ncbi:Crp/Fnr family transcriptional regulator [Lacinutrix jangbogonensis]|uniref:Crp/Fnr family transcriptional regulator n=1 Tax=Lacinutrix jangbogonensis TaxID=1469557 RepID=UPI00053D2FE1|nr:Crp/Fnr family transcriptional regulator [Lacinutrix jangbogonensis]
MENIKEILNLDSEKITSHFNKGDILQRDGENCSKAFFVKKGLLRSYTIDDKGKEHIFMFAPESWVIADIESQEFKQPAKLFIDCVEKSEVIILDRSLLLKSDLNIIQLKNNINLLSRRVAVLQRRVIMLMSASAKDRYELFLETYPELPNRVPQRMIASYVGITPEALSKIRGKIAKSK